MVLIHPNANSEASELTEMIFQRNNFKRLWVVKISEQLNFNEHVTNICKSAYRELNAVSKVYFKSVSRI